MSAKATPSKTPSSDLTYVECSWTFSRTGSLYVRLSPVIAEALKLKRQVHFRRLGKVDRVSYTKKLKTGEAKHAYVFKFDVNTSQDDESQCVDGSDNVIYALKEDKFSDFSVDTMAGKLFGGKWRPHQPLLDAHKEAQKKKKLSSQGNWLKDVFKSDVLETQDSASSSPAGSLLTTPGDTAPPEGFSFLTHKEIAVIRDATIYANKKSVEHSDDEEEDDDYRHNEQTPASPTLGLASQRVASTHFDLLLVFLLFSQSVFCLYSRSPKKEETKGNQRDAQ